MSLNKSHGPKSISAVLKTRDLIEETPELVNIWTARVMTLFTQGYPGVLRARLTGKAFDDRV